MFYFYLVLTFLSDVAISYFSLVKTPVDLWKSVVIFPFLYLGFFIIHVFVFAMYSLTTSKDEVITDVNNSHKRFMILTLRLFLKMGRVSYEIENEELLPEDDRYLLVCNHASVFDPIVSFVLLPEKKLAFVSKKENMEIPFAGRYMHKVGCIPIDRENNREAVKAINRAAEYIDSGLCAIGIYPEGYVNDDKPGLLEFRNGAFKIAKKAHSPIVVSVIKNTRDVNKHIFLKRTKVTLKIIRVIPYETIEKLKTVEIGSMVRELMYENL